MYLKKGCIFVKEITTKTKTKMELTQNQTIEIKILVLAMKETLLSSVNGVAEVAKAIQLYLSCEFSEAVKYLSNNLEDILYY